ncbi:hypothetical protein Hanom_Chr07g00648401 [Helianthus anomalus]
MNDHLEIPLFHNLFRKVSIHALNLLENGLKRRLCTLRSFGSTCGCQLYTDCGLLLACRLEKLQNRENVFRTPASEEKHDAEDQGGFNPLMSDKNPPVVQVNTRGRLTSKVQQQKRDRVLCIAQLGLSNKAGVTHMQERSLLYNGCTSPRLPSCWANVV